MSSSSVDGSVAPDYSSLQKVLGLMRDVQEKMKGERQDLVKGVAQQVRDARLEMYRSQQCQDDLAKQITSLMLRLNSVGMLNDDSNQKGAPPRLPTSESPPPRRPMDQTFSMDSPTPATSGGAMQSSVLPVKGGSSSWEGFASEATSRVNLLHESVRRNTEEMELLKVALFHDRLVREERNTLLDAEEEAMEQRLRVVEATNDGIRGDIQTVRNATKQVLEMLEALTQHERREAAPPQFNIYELDRLAVDVEATLERVREEHATLCGKLESLQGFYTAEETKRREALTALEESLAAVQKDLTTHKDAKQHLPFRKEQRDVPSEWLKGLNSSEPASYVSGDHSSQLYHDTLHPPLSAAEELQIRLEQFYSIYNPSKIDDVQRIMEEYCGAEEELFAALEVHYGCFGYFSQH